MGDNGEGIIEVAIIGAGIGGISAAYHLQRRGITNFVILERAPDIGGTWRDNHYPGLAVDIPTLWYQFSFAPNNNWSRLFAPGREIYHYLADSVRKLGLWPHMRTNAEVTQQIWDDGAGLWTLHLAGGDLVRARYVVSAVGGYINAKTSVTLPGMADFGGRIMRPNAWDDAYDVAGKNVAVIGTGSSGAQIAGALTGQAASVRVFQRTPGWILPKVDFDMPGWMRGALAIPGVLAGMTAVGRLVMDAALMPLFHILPHLPDPVLRTGIAGYDAYLRLLYQALLRVVVKDKLTRRALMPRYGIVGKRPVFSNAFLAAFNHPTTTLITTPIDRVTARGIRTLDGVDHPVDLIVMATGYEMWTDPETYRRGTVVGRNGFDLAEAYHRNGLRAYAGTCRPELPNRWDLVGPMGFQGIAWPEYVEMIAEHAVRVIAEARSRDTGIVAVSQSAFERWNHDAARRARVVQLYFHTGNNVGLNTYYLNSHREALYYRPQTITGTRRFVRRSPDIDYEFTQSTPITRSSREIPA